MHPDRLQPIAGHDIVAARQERANNADGDGKACDEEREMT
jgi:hypothetical protein